MSDIICVISKTALLIQYSFHIKKLYDTKTEFSYSLFLIKIFTQNVTFIIFHRDNL